MTESDHDTLAEYLVPLEKDAADYRVSEAWAKCGSDPYSRYNLFEAADLSFTRARVTLGDSSAWIAQITVSPHDPNEYFLLTDSDGTPLGAHEIRPRTAVTLRKYFDDVRNELSYSEGILPDQRAFIWNQFVFPRLSMDDDQLNDLHRLRECSRVLVVGSPGAGKTTLLRRLALESVESDSPDAIPVFILLRHWQPKRGVNALFREVCSPQHLNSSSEDVKSVVSGGGIWFFLDGFDEIPLEYRREAEDDINKFSAEHQYCKIILSCRPAAVPSSLLNYRKCWVNPLSKSQMKEVVWHKLSDDWSGFWNRIEQEPEVREICSNPLALTLLVARYSRRDSSPHHVTDLTNDILNMYLDEWDSIRGITRNLSYRFSRREKKMALLAFARYLSERNTNASTFEEWEQVMGTLPTSIPANEVLRMLEEYTGLLRQTSQGAIEFSHKAFQDFFWTESLTDSLTSVSSNILTSLSSAASMTWRFLTGLTSNADPSIRILLENQASDPLGTFRSLSAALTQNISVSNDVIDGYCLLSRGLLEQAMQGGSRRPSSESGIAGLTIFWHEHDSVPEYASATSEILPAICAVRDSHAAPKLLHYLQSSANEHVVYISKLIFECGTLRSTLDDSGHSMRITAVDATRSPD